MSHTSHRITSTPMFSQYIEVYHTKSPVTFPWQVKFRLGFDVLCSDSTCIFSFRVPNGCGNKYDTQTRQPVSWQLVAAFGSGSSECVPFSTCIAGADFVIKIALNEVRQWRRRLQRGECIVASFPNQHRERQRQRYEVHRALCPLACSWCCLLSSYKGTYWLLEKDSQSCQMTSNVNLHINIFAVVPSTLDRKVLHLLQAEDVKLKCL